MSNERSYQCGQVHGACTTEFQYAVKLVCGVVAATPAGAPTPVAPGRYWTATNIHNPDKCKDAHFHWKVAVALPGAQGPVSVYQRPQKLSPDAALEIDCAQVMRVVQALFPPPATAPTFAKGYVVIESDIKLDVVAVYSGQGTCGLFNSFQTERVQPRRVPVCEDLVLPLHTGFADWRTVPPTGGPPVVVLGSLNTAWAVPPFGSSWVSQSGADSSTASPGVRSYELCFNLCFGFAVPAPFQIQLLADNSAEVTLNAHHLGTNNPTVPANGFATPTTINVTTADLAFLHAGRNCLRVDVTNNPPVGTGNPTGFALAGILRVIRGKCPCDPLPIAAKSPVAAALEEQSVEPSVSG